jgi:hypothetical protein
MYLPILQSSFILMFIYCWQNVAKLVTQQISHSTESYLSLLKNAPHKGCRYTHLYFILCTKLLYSESFLRTRIKSDLNSFKVQVILQRHEATLNVHDNF